MGRKWNGSAWEVTAETERNTDNYGNMKDSFPLPTELHFTSFSALLLPNPLVRSPHVLSSLLPGPSASDPLTVWLFFGPSRCLPSLPPSFTSSLHLRHIPVLSTLLFPFNLPLLSSLPLSLSSRPINSSCERRCLIVDCSDTYQSWHPVTLYTSLHIITPCLFVFFPPMVTLDWLMVVIQHQHT